MTPTDNETQTDYRNRINRVFTFIDENLESVLSLDNVSAIAFFSPFHFHRVFKWVTGETLHEYITRQRVEKAALDLLHTTMSVTEIAHKYGYSDNASFSRAFKTFFGISPTAFKGQNSNRHSRIRQVLRKNGQAYPDANTYICIVDNLKNWMNMNAKIEYRKTPGMDLAYVSCMGPKNLAHAYGTLMQWATPQGLINGQTKMVTIYHDSFKVTEANSVRMSASILLNKPVATQGEIGLTAIEAGTCIVGSFEIAVSEFEKSWTGLFLWMNENGYKKAAGNPFEVYHNNVNEHPEGLAIVDFYIPVELKNV